MEEEGWEETSIQSYNVDLFQANWKSQSLQKTVEIEQVRVFEHFKQQTGCHCDILTLMELEDVHNVYYGSSERPLFISKTPGKIGSYLLGTTSSAAITSGPYQSKISTF